MKTIKSREKNFTDQLKKLLWQSNEDNQVRSVVRDVLNQIQQRGDSAVIEFTKKFDGADMTSGYKVLPESLIEAMKNLSMEESKAMDESIESVSAFHKKCLPRDWTDTNTHGAIVGEKFDPIQRVGIYIPGGQVPLVSTVIMTVTLAKIAGVPEIAVVTPPQKDGTIHPYLLAALAKLDIDEVYAVGGIQAVGALAFGTETIPSVDKIYGPGNAYVMEAKRQVLGICGMDLLPGPSEIMVIADKTANPAFVAADLLSQAEHGSGKEKIYWASVNHPELGKLVDSEINKQIVSLTHAEKIRTVLEKNTVLIECDNNEEAIKAANLIAPEHLEIQVSEDAIDTYKRGIVTAGCMLLGEMTPTVLGDFVAGPSHTLPTGTSGRFFSGLRLEDFMRRTSLISYDLESAKKAQNTVSCFSKMEQLDAHGNSLSIRFK